MNQDSVLLRSLSALHRFAPGQRDPGAHEVPCLDPLLVPVDVEDQRAVRNPTLTVIERIAKALKVPIAELLG